MKRAISLILAFAMILSFTSVFAANTITVIKNDSGVYEDVNGDKAGIIRFLSEINYDSDAELEEYGMQFIPTALYAPDSLKLVTLTNTNVQGFKSGDTFTADLKNISEGFMDKEFIGVAFAKFKGSENYILSPLGSFSKAKVNEDKGLGVKQALQCDEKGDFKILIAADPHGNAKTENWDNARAAFETLIAKEDPDFVIIHGDTYMKAYGPLDQASFKKMVEPMEKRGIKWTVTNGNHDPYNEANWAFFNTFNGFVGENVDENDPNYVSDRPTNFVLPVYKNDGKTPVFAVWAMDTGVYNSGKYDGVTQKQIDWYKAKSAEIKSKYGDLTGLMCLHIPPTEMIDLYYSKKSGGTNTVGQAGDAFQPIYGGIYDTFEGVTNYTTSTGTFVSTTAMNATHPDNNRGVFAAMKEMGNIDISISGHDHGNNYIGVYDGIMMGFTGRMIDAKESCGARVIEFNQKNPDGFTTKWIALNEYGEDQPSIYKDGSRADEIDSANGLAVVVGSVGCTNTEEEEIYELTAIYNGEETTANYPDIRDDLPMFDNLPTIK